MKILIVDDSKHFVKALRFMLEENFSDKIEEILEASNGQEAIDFVSNYAIDTIFMDLEMPVMDGVKATKYIVDRYRNIQIIAVSFHSEFHDIQRMIEAGARNYLIKEEVNIESLERCLSNQ